jgi:hypothetical protein
MALRAGTQWLPRAATRKATLGWSGALAVGLAAVSLRSISSHGSTGDIRYRYGINARYRAALRSISTTSSNLFFSATSPPATMTITPPQAPPTWEHSAEDITNLTKQSIEEYRKVMDKIGALEPKDSTFESVSSFRTSLLHELTRFSRSS